MTNARVLLGAASALALSASLASAAQAQTPGETTASATDVGEVVVTGVRKSLREALQVKESSDKVVEAISAKDIGVLPDVTIAESIARLPGVNATRDRGNDSQAVVRGLGARLVLGTINGREVASSEPDRNVRWEIYPSEVVAGVQVYKSQSADLIAGGVAATINISTLDPLDYSGPSIVLRGGPVYYDGGKNIPNYDRTGYRASGSFVHKFGPDLAVVLGLTAQDQKNGYPSFTGWGYNDSAARPPVGASDSTGDLNGDGKPDPTPWGAQISASRIDQKRVGVSGGVTWSPTSQFVLKADALYSKIKIDERQDQTVWGRNNWGNWANGNAGDYNAAGASYTLVDGDVVAGRLPWSSVTTVLAHYTEDKTLFVGGLNGRWTNEDWTVTGDISHSEAKRENKWMAVRTEAYPEWTTFDTRADRTPTITTSTPSISLAQYANQGLQSDGPEHLNDKLSAAQLDVSRGFSDGVFKSLDFGVRLSDRTKDHDRTNIWVSGNGSQVPANLFTAYHVGAVNIPDILTGDFDAIARAAYGSDPFARPGTEDLSQQWKVREKVAEAYLMGRFGGDAFGAAASGNVGVRFVRVESTSQGYQQATGSSPLAPATVDADDSEVLPSANLKLDYGEGRIVRLGVAKVVARPPLDELRASRTLTSWQPYTGSAGNPNLEPFRATQFDASFEWYFRPEALAAVSTYYKDVDSYIGWRQTPVNFGGITYAVSSPTNGGGGSIKGVELSFQTPFFFLAPSPLQHFGIYSNYAYVSSDLREFSPANDPLELTGLAKHNATVDLWYANGKLEGRLGWKYHSPMTVIYGWSGADLQTLEAESTLDFSASYQVTQNVGVRFQANNLTNEPLRMYRDNRPDRIGRYDVYGRRFLFDVTLKF